MLLGFHYYYLGYSKQALTELDKTLQLEPKDPMARQLRNIVAAKLGLPASPAPPGAQGPGLQGPGLQGPGAGGPGVGGPGAQNGGPFIPSDVPGKSL
jgi:hypothetical protein